MNATLKKLYYALVIGLTAVSSGAEQLTFTPAPNQTTVVASEKAGNHIKLSVSPDLLGKTAQGTPRQVFNTLQAELGKAIESKGGMIPGKVYVKKEANGDYTLTVNFAEPVHAAAGMQAGTAWGFATLKVTVKDPIEAIALLHNKKGYVTQSDIDKIIKNDSISLTRTKDGTYNIAAGLQPLQYLETVVHEKIHCLDYDNDKTVNEDKLYAYSIIGSKGLRNQAQSQMDAVMQSANAKLYGAHVTNTGKKTINCAEKILMYKEARAVFAEIVVRSLYLRDVREKTIGILNKHVNKCNQLTEEINKLYKELSNIGDKQSPTYLSLYKTIEKKKSEKEKYIKIIDKKDSKDYIPGTGITYAELLKNENSAQRNIITLAQNDVLSEKNLFTIKGISTTYGAAFSSLYGQVEPIDVWNTGYSQTSLVSINETNLSVTLLVNSKYGAEALAEEIYEYGITRKSNESNFQNALKELKESTLASFALYGRATGKHTQTINFNKDKANSLIQIKLNDNYVGKSVEALTKEIFVDDHKILLQILNFVVDKETAKTVSENEQAILPRWVANDIKKRHYFVNLMKGSGSDDEAFKNLLGMSGAALGAQPSNAGAKGNLLVEKQKVISGLRDAMIRIIKNNYYGYPKLREALFSHAKIAQDLQILERNKGGMNAPQGTNPLEQGLRRLFNM